VSIQWFPGHMHKAGKEMAAKLPDIDIAVEVLDARLPWSSSNPLLDARLGDKPRLRVMTRADLADPALTDLWLADLTAGSDAALAVRGDAPEAIREIPARLRTLLPGDRPRSRLGPRTAMIVGIPNVGKSTLINRLAGRAIARTGNEPAVTKRQQSVPLGEGWALLDTPGVLWPKVENPASGYRLAASGAVRDTAMDSGEVAAWLLEYLVEAYPERLAARYGESLPAEDGVATLEAIGRLRGCLGAGRLVDFDRAGRLVLQEFRSGTLGPITLETPAMRDAERLATEERRVLLEAKREERRAARKAKRRKRA